MPTSQARSARIRSRAPLLIAIGATMLAVATAIALTIVAQRDARDRAQAGGDALLALHEVLQATLDAETGQRGYLLTSNESYLDPYRDARQRVDASLGRLGAALGAGNRPDDAAQLERLAGLVEAKVGELDETVALTRAGRRAEALAIVQADIGKRQMDAIRGEVRLLQAREGNARQQAFERATRLEQYLIPLIVVLGLVTLGLMTMALRSEQRRAAAEAEAAQADALRAANERAGLLARELNHRVKNLFSVILSIVSLSARSQAPTKVVVEDIRARIRALSLAHVATQGEDGDGHVDLRTVISSTLQPYADHDGERVTIEGPDIEVPVRMVTPLGLVVHELATNAAKYGAFSAEGGKVGVSWELRSGADGARIVSARWRETGGPAPQIDDAQPGGTGFGTRMIALAISQLGGTLDRQWPATGAVAHFEFPVSGNAQD